MSIIDNLESQLWVEKYAPQCVEDTILPDRIKNVLREYATSKQVRSYTAIGSAGSGKTSSAKALLKEIDAEYLLTHPKLVILKLFELKFANMLQK